MSRGGACSKRLRYAWSTATADESWASGKCSPCLKQSQKLWGGDSRLLIYPEDYPIRVAPPPPQGILGARSLVKPAICRSAMYVRKYATTDHKVFTLAVRRVTGGAGPPPPPPPGRGGGAGGGATVGQI